MDLHSELAAPFPEEPPYVKLQNDLYGLGVPCDPALADFDSAIAFAFRARADVRMARGEYHLALADYGRALRTWPRNYGLVPYPAARARRCIALENLDRYFMCGGDPEKLPAETPDSVRNAIRTARLPSGHLVVAEEGGILGGYPLTDEGREDAVAHADALAADPEARSRIDNLYLAETDDFDTVVYACENGKAVEVHRAPPVKPAPSDLDEGAD